MLSRRQDQDKDSLSIVCEPEMVQRYKQLQTIKNKLLLLLLLLFCGFEIKWIYDPRSYERNVSNCVKKPEIFRTSTGFEPVTSWYQCDALTNWAMKPPTLGAGHLWVLMFGNPVNIVNLPWKRQIKTGTFIDRGKHILKFKIFWMNNKTIIEFGFRIIWRSMRIWEGVIHLGR